MEEARVGPRAVVGVDGAGKRRLARDRAVGPRAVDKDARLGDLERVWLGLRLGLGLGLGFVCGGAGEGQRLGVRGRGEGAGGIACTAPLGWGQQLVYFSSCGGYLSPI